MDPIRRLARELRNDSTDAERALWNRIRQRQLKNFRLRRQHTVGRHIADFAGPEAGLIVELDGGHHLAQVEADSRRTRDLESAGYRDLRFWNDDVLKRTDEVVAAIIDALAD